MGCAKSNIMVTNKKFSISLSIRWERPILGSRLKGVGSDIRFWSPLMVRIVDTHVTVSTMIINAMKDALGSIIR